MITEIINNLWIGNKNDAFNKEFLKNRNINIIINVSDDIPFIEDEELNIEKIRIPISDKFKNKDDMERKNREMYYHLEEISIFIKNKLSFGKTIFIHCNRGKIRSPTIILSFLIYILKKPLNKIYNQFQNKYFLKKKLNEFLFLKALIDFEKDILK